MVVTVEQGIPMNARGFFLRERDALNAQYGVQLKFPKGREFMHGNYQTMLMVGTQRNINSLMPQVRRILTEAREQYESFKERQSRRRANATRPPTSSIVTESKSTTTAPKQNPFAVLDGLHEQETAQLEAEHVARKEQDRLRDEKKEQKKREKEAIINGTAPKPLPRPATTMNYAAMAAKAKPVAEVKKVEAKPAVKLVIVPKKSTVSWADMASEDEDNDDEQVDNTGLVDAWNGDWSNMDWSEM